MSITIEELQLAARNHGMPLEALRYDLTPVGLHYLLVHFDVPEVPGDWRLRIGGHVDRELSLSLDELRARPSVRRIVTMECAGNGRARLDPRVISQPWLAEAVGTGEWGGVELAPLLEEAGVRAGGVEVVFGGLDRGIDGGVEQSYERSLSLADACEGEALLAYELNGEPLPPQHGAPLRLVVPGWYGMTSVKWVGRITVLDRPFDGYQQVAAYRFRRNEDDEGEPLTLMRPRALMVPPGMPEFMSRRRYLPCGPCLLEGRAWSGVAPVAAVEVSVDGGERWAPARPPPPRPLGLVPLDVAVGGSDGRPRARLPGARRGRERAAVRAGVERRRLREQRGPARRRHRPLKPGVRPRLLPRTEPALCGARSARAPARREASAPRPRSPPSRGGHAAASG